MDDGGRPIELVRNRWYRNFGTRRLKSEEKTKRESGCKPDQTQTREIKAIEKGIHVPISIPGRIYAQNPRIVKASLSIRKMKTRQSGQ